jgi:glutathione peroxidase
MSLYNYSFIDNDWKDVNFYDYKDQVVLVVNVASNCGFTKQYEGLQSLHTKYYDQGLRIVAFPCNQFGGQEPGSDEEIKSFCTKNYGVTFPVSIRVDVKGEGAHPVYKYLVKETGRDIDWNFDKFIIDRQGKVTRKSPDVTPEDIESEIQRMLAQ